MMINFQFETVDKEHLPPDEIKSGDIFSRLGYGISDAIADLVDNSVDAGGRKVHVRFGRDTEGIHSVIIADNGKGMNNDGLREAMRFGSRSSKTSKQLGKYGIGLKSASLSQAETVTVLTKQGGSTLGRRWTLENVKDNWTCDILQESDVRKAFAPKFGEFHIKHSGTIIIWERLEHLKALPNNLDKILKKTTDALIVELGIRFHRFIENDRLAISIDQQFGLETPTAIPAYVSALNPFSYKLSGHPEYPLVLKIGLNGNAVDVECHIWPSKSNGTAQSVCALLEKIAVRYVGIPIAIILDNARYQRCALVMDKARSLNIRIVFPAILFTQSQPDRESMEVCEKEMSVFALLRKVSCFQTGYLKVSARNRDNLQSRS